MNLIVLGLWQARLVAAVLLKVMNGKWFFFLLLFFFVPYMYFLKMDFSAIKGFVGSAQKHCEQLRLESSICFIIR